MALAVLGVSTPAATGARTAAATGRRRVMIVDDDPDILESIKVLLETSLDGVDVETASSGGEALAKLRLQSVELIITDFRMPGMNGLEFLNAARAIAPRARRALISAFPETAVRAAPASEETIDFFLPKPIDTDAFLRATERSLSGA